MCIKYNLKRVGAMIGSLAYYEESVAAEVDTHQQLQELSLTVSAHHREL